MEQNLTYRIASEEDYPAILKLYNAMYQSDRSLTDFKWLVEDNPAGRATLFIALLENRVIGMQSLIPYDFVQNGQVIHTYKSEDTLVEKGMRGKGVFSKLYEMVHAHADSTLVWGLTDKKEILERVKMPSSERLTIAISVKRPTIASDKRGLHRRIAKTLYYSVLYLKSTFQSRRITGTMKLDEIIPSDYGSKRIEVFFDRLTQQHPNLLFPRMNSGYLNWRLTQNPNLDYYTIMVSTREDGSIAICSLLGFIGKSAYWQSYYAHQDVALDEKIGHIVNLRKKLFDSGISMIHTWLFGCNASVKEVKNLFYQGGFSKVRDGLWIVHNSAEMNLDVHDMYFSPQLGIR
ncbi:MAG: GNAT family N-acetyltransferase [Bacteroidota bacterium]